jgi:hypothetical protein
VKGFTVGDELVHDRVVDEGHANVIPSVESLLVERLSRIGQEKNLGFRRQRWSDVEMLSLGRLPYPVELGFDEKTRELPNSPAVDEVASVRVDLVPHVEEALMGRSAREGLDRHVDGRGSRANLGTKSHDSLVQFLWCALC